MIDLIQKTEEGLRIQTLVVGAGIFGSVIASWLRDQGHVVTLVDAEEPYAASPCAACISKPSWLGKMSSAQQAQSMAVLDKLYGVQDIDAKIGPVSVRVYWTAPSKIMPPGRYTRARVAGLGIADGKPYFRLSDHGRAGEMIPAKRIIVAAGYWTQFLAQVPELRAQAGAAFTWTVPERKQEVRIRPYAPYKQLLSVMLEPTTVWAGDGMSLKPESVSNDRLRASLQRCADFVGESSIHAKMTVGWRPYIKGLAAPCYLEEVMPDIWVVTGGAKSGTAAAGWAAWELGRRLA